MNFGQQSSRASRREEIMRARKYEKLMWQIMDNLKQNYDSLAQYSLEEAYELVNAIEDKNPNEIKKELGDLLLQVVLISQVASDKGDFNFDDVADSVDGTDNLFLILFN